MIGKEEIKEVERAEIEEGEIGKGTTSVVPWEAEEGAALAAEVTF